MFIIVSNKQINKQMTARRILYYVKCGLLVQLLFLVEQHKRSQRHWSLNREAGWIWLRPLRVQYSSPRLHWLKVNILFDSWSIISLQNFWQDDAEAAVLKTKLEFWVLDDTLMVHDDSCECNLSLEEVVDQESRRSPACFLSLHAAVKSCSNCPNSTLGDIDPQEILCVIFACVLLWQRFSQFHLFTNLFCLVFTWNIRISETKVSI